MLQFNINNESFTITLIFLIITFSNVRSNVFSDDANTLSDKHSKEFRHLNFINDHEDDTFNLGSENEILKMKSHFWGPMLHYPHQILITLDPPMNGEKQRILFTALENSSIFINYIPMNSFLFLANDKTIDIAEQLQDVTSIKYLNFKSKLALEWDVLLTYLAFDESHILSSRPIHTHPNKSNMTSSLNRFFGTFEIDKLNKEKFRVIAIVKFPSLLKKANTHIKDELSSYRPAKAAKNDWESILKKISPLIEIRSEDHSLEVVMPPEHIKHVITFLAKQPSVHYIYPKSQIKIHNWRATAIIQSAKKASTETGEIDPIAHPIWHAGITGLNQIIGCGDSGLDIDNCFFYDPNVNFDDHISFSFEAKGNIYYNENHRKIIYYNAGSADMIDSDGHGTHVVGSIVGEPYSESGGDLDVAYRGVAPKAKIAFIDLSIGGNLQGENDTEDDRIYTPADLAIYYYPFTYKIGAKIHSDSWGSDTAIYDYLASQVDQFAYENDDFLPIFAAGNYGKLSTEFMTTVTSPAVAKNCIAVGATLTADEIMSSMIINRVATYETYGMTIIQQEAIDSFVVKDYKLLQGTFGGSWRTIIEGKSGSEGIKLRAGDPEDGCTQLAHGIKDTIVLLVRGTCTFAEKLRNVQQKGGIGAIVTNDLETGYFEMIAENEDVDDLTIPIASLPKNDGRRLWTLLEKEDEDNPGTLIYVKVTEKTQPEDAFENIAEYSSTGPTSDRRIKPDLVAPGRIKSASSDGFYDDEGDQCALSSMSGTSMATPIVAGAAALVRDYFMSGFYPSGERNKKNEYQPSGALIKAVLIGGADAMDGYTETGLPLESPPSSRQGFGRVYLEQSIPVQSSNSWKNGWRIQVIDRAEIKNGEFHEYCVKAFGGPLKVTLVWTDPPASDQAETSLINDLDLTVRSAGLKGEILYGNGYEDRVNNIEKVSIEYLPEGNIEIKVVAHQIIEKYSPQKYALVVQGHFNGIIQSEYNPYQSTEKSTDDDLCVITLALITSGPSGPISNNSPEFVFTSHSGIEPYAGFECKLSDASNSTNDAHLHEWKACTSPYEYKNLPDGDYLFSVRPKEEDIAASTNFTVDTVSPITSYITYPEALISATEKFEFDFEAEDETTTEYECKLEYSGNSKDTSLKIRRLKQRDPDVKMGKWFECESPEEYFGMSQGNWTFTIKATDAANNTETKPVVIEQSIVFNENEVYVRTTENPYVISSSPDVTFGVEVILGHGFDKDYDIITDVSDISCGLFEKDNYGNEIGTYQPCNKTITFSNVNDGTYVYKASVDSNTNVIYPTSFEFEIDTTRPIVSITKSPPYYYAEDKVSFEFEVTNNDDIFEYECSVAKINETHSFEPCNNKNATYQLKDGHYIFRVGVEDLAGNYGLSNDTEFIIDTTMPRILFLTPDPLYSNKTEINVDFEILDFEGSGFNPESLTCTLEDEGNEYFNITNVSNCTMPVEFNLEEGAYIFKIAASDMAGNVDEEEYPIIIDLSKPNVSVTDKPDTNEDQPSYVLIQFEGEDYPAITASLIDYYECKLSKGTSKTTSNDTMFSNEQDLMSIEEDVLNEDKTSSEEISIVDGLFVTLDKWIVCESPVIYQGMSSGVYAFRVRPIDAAENIGDPSEKIIFTVDASLPIPGETAPSDEFVIPDYTIYGLLLILIIVLILIVFIVIACRIKDRKKRQKLIEEKERKNADMVRSQDAEYARALQNSINQNAYVNPESYMTSQNRQREEYEYQRAVEESMRYGNN